MEFLIISFVVAAASTHAHLSARQLRLRFAEDEQQVANLKSTLNTISTRTN